MSDRDFVKWLQGFTEAVDDVPTKSQWDTLIKKLSEVNELTQIPTNLFWR